jgi:prolyl-tRNA synthetase
MAPFDLALVPLGARKSAQVRETAEHLYRELTAAGLDVLLDDRDERPGVALSDMELIGVPHRVVVGERGLKDGNVEYQGRRDARAQPVALKDAVESVKSRVCGDSQAASST